MTDLAATVVRIERAAADQGKRALQLVLAERDRRVVQQVARRLGISTTVVGRATWVVESAPELVGQVMSGAMTMWTAANIARERRPRGRRRDPNVVVLSGADVRIDVNWIADQIAGKLGTTLDVICALPRAEDVADVLAAREPLPHLAERVARATAWLNSLNESLKARGDR